MHQVDGSSLKKYFGIDNDIFIEGTVIKIPAQTRMYWNRDKDTDIVTLDTVEAFDCRVEWDNGYRNSFKFRDLKMIRK